MKKSLNEKIADKQRLIEQLANEKKQLIQKQKSEERKERTSRLCRRHGLLEKYMPTLISITDEQFEDFIKRGINTSYGQKILAEIIDKSNASITATPPITATGGGTNGGANPPQAATSGA